MLNNCKNKNISCNKTLNFSRWSRKSYAVFASIGRIVKISNLKIEVSQGFIKKNKTLSAIQTFFNIKRNTNDKAQPGIVELVKSDILQFELLINNSSKNCNSSKIQLSNNIYFNNIKCMNFVHAFFVFTIYNNIINLTI